MIRYLIDTNHLGVLAGPSGRLRERLVERHRIGDKFGTTLLCLFELEAGFAVRKQSERSRQRLNSVRSMLKLWPLEAKLAQEYAQAFNITRAAGKVIGFVDLILIAMARTSGAIILRTDRDFEALPDVKTENWIV